MGVIYASRVENDFDPDVESGKKQFCEGPQGTSTQTNDNIPLGSLQEQGAFESSLNTFKEQTPDHDAMEICSSTPVQQPVEDLTSFSRRVCCRSTLEKLVSLPPKNNTQKIRNLDLHSNENPSSVGESVLSSLDLARQVS